MINFHKLSEYWDNRSSDQASAQSLLDRWNLVVKRTFDIVAAFVGLILLSPLFLLAWIAIKRDSPGPAFYRGPRVGKHGKNFQILKFRTMYESPESHEGPRLTCAQDDRITPLGRWLRRTKLNELPQLWNVLVGDMSLVGPRPEDPELIKAWPNDAREEILSGKPGITSPASVFYHCEENILSKNELIGMYFNDILPNKIRLDRLYVRNRSFSTDLDVIFLTLALFIPPISEAGIPETLLLFGPLSRFVHRYVSWFLIDFVTLLTAAIASAILWRTQGPYDWGPVPLLGLVLLLALLFSVVNALAGFNRILWAEATAADAFGLIVSSGFVAFLILMLNHLQYLYEILPYPALPPVLIVTIGLLAQIGFLCTRYHLRILTGISEFWLTRRSNLKGIGERVLIAGSGEGCQMANWLLRRRMFRHIFSIAGIVSTDEPKNQGMRINGCWVLGGISDLREIVARQDIGVVVCTSSNVDSQVGELLADLCKNFNVKLVFLEDLISIMQAFIGGSAGPVNDPEWLRYCAQSGMMYDWLTGISTPLLLQERLRHALSYAQRYNTHCAVLVIELEDLHAVRKVRGKIIADEFLKCVAGRLAGIKRQSDTLGRCNSKEFVLILENTSEGNVIGAVTKRILGAMAEPAVVLGETLRLNLRIRAITDLQDISALVDGGFEQMLKQQRPEPELQSGYAKYAPSGWLKAGPSSTQAARKQTGSN
jgi:diguanylate cyclase (GGDEF)-like protein